MPSTTGKSLDELKQMRKDLMSQGKQLSTSKSLGKVEQAIKVANPSGYSADQVSSAQQNLKLINEPTVSGMGGTPTGIVPTTTDSGLAMLEKQLADKNAALTKATGNVNDNPWYSEATRTGKLYKLNNIAQMDINSLQNAIAQKKADTQQAFANNMATQQFDLEKQRFAASQAGSEGIDFGTGITTTPTTPKPIMSAPQGTVSGEWVASGEDVNGFTNWQPVQTEITNDQKLQILADQAAKKGNYSVAASIYSSIGKAQNLSPADQMKHDSLEEALTSLDSLANQLSGVGGGLGEIKGKISTIPVVGGMLYPNQRAYQSSMPSTAAVMAKALTGRATGEAYSKILQGLDISNDKAILDKNIQNQRDALVNSARVAGFDDLVNVYSSNSNNNVDTTQGRYTIEEIK